MTYSYSHSVWLPIYAHLLCAYICDVTIVSPCDWSHDPDCVEKEGSSRHVKFRSLRACQSGFFRSPERVFEFEFLTRSEEDK